MLSTEMKEILKHIVDRGCRPYCGNKTDKHLMGLVYLGLLKKPVSVGWIHKDNGYFHITKKGREALNE